MVFPADFYFRSRVSRLSVQPKVNFDTAVNHAKKQPASDAAKRPKPSNDVIIHQVKHGDTAIKVGNGYGYRLEQLQLMNPGLRENADMIVEGDTLTILDRGLFDTVKSIVSPDRRSGKCGQVLCEDDKQQSRHADACAKTQCSGGAVGAAERGREAEPGSCASCAGFA